MEKNIKTNKSNNKLSPTDSIKNKTKKILKNNQISEFEEKKKTFFVTEQYAL